MTFSSDDSTPNQGLSATRQATRELGDSQEFLEIRGVTRLSRNSPVDGRENCPHCGSDHLSKGAGLKPGQMSLKCSECKAFIGYRNLQELKKLKRRKRLTPCLELLEKQGISGDAAIFVLGQVGGET
jgi:DNA-directed RNA polymerase subunit RPC12/RpoP